MGQSTTEARYGIYPTFLANMIPPPLILTLCITHLPHPSSPPGKSPLVEDVVVFRHLDWVLPSFPHRASRRSPENALPSPVVNEKWESGGAMEDVFFLLPS